jgi:Domain of unknown function (DUF1851)
MKYKKFLAKYPVTKIIAGEKPKLNDTAASKGIKDLSVAVYLNGLYTIVNRAEGGTLTKLTESVFPAVVDKITVFAVDWMGRLFATDKSEPDSSGAATITCFDFAEPSSFSTDANFDDFHNSTAIDMMSELFNLEQFEQWTSEHQPPTDGVSCVGYKTPLFLGGEDDQENMEMTDRSVYLHMLSELWSSVKDLPEGSRIKQIEFEEQDPE